MDVDQEETIENRRNLFRFYNYLTTLLPNSDLNVMVAASKSLGKIAKIGDQVLGERFIEHEVPDSIELLSSTDKTEQSRYAGVLVLKELARNSPMYFIQHISLIFDKILLPLRDPRVCRGLLARMENFNLLAGTRPGGRCRVARGALGYYG